MWQFKTSILSELEKIILILCCKNSIVKCAFFYYLLFNFINWKKKYKKKIILHDLGRLILKKGEKNASINYPI